MTKRNGYINFQVWSFLLTVTTWMLILATPSGGSAQNSILQALRKQ